MATVLVPLAQGCEELEAVTVIDILRRAKITVVTVGLDDQPVIASREVKLIPDTTLDAVLNDDFDMIVLPGGLPGADNLNADPRIHSLLKKMNADGKFIAAICAAPKILADAGLLKHKRITYYPGALNAIHLALTTPCLGQTVVRDGTIITSRGPGTAMDFALKLVEVLLGEETRRCVEPGLVRTVEASLYS
jgi:4-methyl-5(b-hydroxyethyl)-thiazole monophosphate biosynthesis